jgi:hypothetical protein
LESEKEGSDQEHNKKAASRVGCYAVMLLIHAFLSKSCSSNVSGKDNTIPEQIEKPGSTPHENLSARGEAVAATTQQRFSNHRQNVPGRHLLPAHRRVRYDAAASR